MDDIAFQVSCNSSVPSVWAGARWAASFPRSSSFPPSLVCSAPRLRHLLALPPPIPASHGRMPFPRWRTGPILLPRTWGNASNHRGSKIYPGREQGLMFVSNTPPAEVGSAPLCPPVAQRGTHLATPASWRATRASGPQGRAIAGPFIGSPSAQ